MNGPDENRYLQKVSSLLTAAATAHVAQNVATKFRMGSPATAKKLAGSFAEGYHGLVDKSLGRRLSNAWTGAATPDVQVMSKTFHDMGKSLRPYIDKLSRRQQVGLRMASEGRYSQLVRRGYHRDPNIQSALDHVSKTTGLSVPRLADLTESTAKSLEKTWTDKKYPLLSNVSKHISRGKPSPRAVAGNYGTTDALLGSSVLGAVEPAAGAISLSKNLASSGPIRNNKYAKKAIDYAEKKFVMDPAKKGWNTPGNNYSGLGSKIMEYGVSPTSVQVKRTSSALSDVVNKTREGLTLQPILK